MNPVQKFVLDIIEAAVLGAAVAAVGLPDSITAKEAIGVIAGGAVGSIKACARIVLTSYIASRKA